MRYLLRFLVALAALAFAACGGKGGECAEPPDIADVWEFAATGISNSCNGLGSYTFPVTIAQDGNTLSGETPGGTLAGTVCGDRMQMSGTIPPMLSYGGTKTADLQLTISADGNSMTGSDTWTWTRGVESCEGSESLKVTRVGNDVCDWASSCPCQLPLDKYCEGSDCPTYEQALAAAEEAAWRTGCDCAPFGVNFGAGQCGNLGYVVEDCHDVHVEYFDASGTLVAAYWWTDGCGGVCQGSCSVNYGTIPECEREQEQDFCDQGD